MEGRRGARLVAGATAGAFGVVEAVPEARAELDDGIFGAGAEAAVALEAVAAGQAAARLDVGLHLVQPAVDLVEIGHPVGRVELGLGGAPVGLVRTIERTVITSDGDAFATANTLCRRDSMVGKIGRQSQSWVKFPEGWRVVSAHVSVIAD